MTNGNACFAYFNKSWGIPSGDCEIQVATAWFTMQHSPRFAATRGQSCPFRLRVDAYAGHECLI